MFIKIEELTVRAVTTQLLGAKSCGHVPSLIKGLLGFNQSDEPNRSLRTWCGAKSYQTDVQAEVSFLEKEVKDSSLKVRVCLIM